MTVCWQRAHSVNEVCEHWPAPSCEDIETGTPMAKAERYDYRKMVSKCIDYIRNEEFRGFAGPYDGPGGLFTPDEWAELQRIGKEVEER